MKENSLKFETFLGTFLAALSIASLIYQGLGISWDTPFQQLVMACDALKAKLMIPFLPFAAALVDYISSILDFHLDLQDHWSDIFILLYLYFFVRGRTYWDYGRKNCAIFRWTWGL